MVFSLPLTRNLLRILFVAFNAAFTLNGFDDQEQNLTFVKTDFQVLKFKFHACVMKQAFYLLHKQNFARVWQQESTFLQTFHSVPGCQTCMYKHDIRFMLIIFIIALRYVFLNKNKRLLLPQLFVIFTVEMLPQNYY